MSTDASATDWALGIKARSQALVNEGEAAERFYLEAIEKLSRTLVRADLAAHIYSTANGYGGRAAASTHEYNYGLRTRS